MKFQILIYFILLSTASFAQKDSLVQIPGTKCSMIPPPNFEKAPNFSGFMDRSSGSSIMISEIPAPYAEILKGFSTEELQTQGMVVIDKQTVIISTGEALLLTINQQANNDQYIKHVLMFGDSSYTVIINGVYPTSAMRLEEDMKKSLLSVHFDANRITNSETEVNFGIEVGNSGFKFATFMSGSLLFTTDAEVPTKSLDNEMIVVGNSLQKVPTAERKDYCTVRLKALPYGESNVISEMNAVTINGLEGYEIIAYGVDKQNQKQLVYQLMIFNTAGEYLIMLGTSTANFENYITTYKKIGKTLTYR